jgi:hypothetical protein
VSEKNLEIPFSLVEENLTLSEIGAIVVLMASPSISWTSKKLWDNDRNFTKTIESLQRQKIISIDLEGSIVVDFKGEKVSTETN